MFKKIASNTFSQILSKALTAIISIFLLSILTKYLPTETFWQYNKIYNYLAIFTFLADLWLYTISIREISKDQSKASYIIWNVMTLRFILAIFIIWLSVWIAFFITWYNSYYSILWIIIVAFFSLFSLLNSSVLSLMQSFMKIEFSLFSAVFGKIITLFVIIFVFYFLHLWRQDALIFVFLAWLIWIIINFLLNFFYANKIAKIRFLFDFKYMISLFKISLPFWIALFLSVVYFKIDILILSFIEPENIQNISIALYSLPMKIIEVLMVLSLFFLNSILPILSKSFEDNNVEKIKNLLKNSFRFLFWFSMFIVLLGFIFAKDILLIISNDDYINNTKYTYTSLDVFYIVLFVLLFYFISMLYNYYFIASKKESIILKINIFITIFNIIWNILIIPFYSFYWRAIITLISQILLFLILYYFSNKDIKINIDFLYILKILIFSLVLFIFWKQILNYFDSNSYINILLFWFIFSFIYLLYFYFLNQDIIKKWIKNS